MTEEDVQLIPAGDEKGGRGITVNGVEFEGAIGGIQRDRLQEISILVHDINFYLNSPVETIAVNPTMKASGSAGEVIELARRIFDEPEPSPEATAWHELSHQYFHELRGELDDRLETGRWKPFAEELNHFYIEAVEGSLTNPSLTKVSPVSNVMKWASFKDNSVIALFNPANYRGGKHSDEHPHWHSGELFAYASEVMRYYPDGLKSRVDMLETESERQLASQVLRKVALAFTEKPNHPKSLDGMKQFI